VLRNCVAQIPRIGGGDQLAIKQVKVSDLDGSEGAEVGAVVRDYPGLDAPRILDVTQAQADALAAKAVKDVVTVELRLPDTSTSVVLVAKAELDEWFGNDEVLKKAAYLKGRRPGFSPKNGNA
jgi:hypothetical protein